MDDEKLAFHGAVKGAIIGGLVAIGIPVALLAFAVIGYKGGGANIEIGLLFFALPVYLPLAIWFGWKMGKKHSRK